MRKVHPPQRLRPTPSFGTSFTVLRKNPVMYCQTLVLTSLKHKTKFLGSVLTEMSWCQTLLRSSIWRWRIRLSYVRAALQHLWSSSRTLQKGVSLAAGLPASSHTFSADQLHAFSCTIKVYFCCDQIILVEYCCACSLVLPGHSKSHCIGFIVYCLPWHSVRQ